MSRFALIVLGFALYGASAAADVLIQNVTIVTPEHAKPLLHQHVLIRGERIAQVSSQPIRIANAIERIDGTNRFLTPGLMDAHVHLSEAPGLPPGSNDPQHQRLRESFLRQQPRSYLYFGVTQLLDPVSFDAATTLFESQPVRPDVFRCGAAPALDGYPSLFVPTPMRYEVFANYIFEPANASKHPLPADAKAEEHTPEAVIGRIAASGATCVKVFLEPGFGRAKDWPLPSAQTLARVRAETRKRGLLMVAHANSLRAQRIAVAAQVDVIAHGLWNWDEESDKQGVPPAIAAHLREVRANRIGFQPTLRVLPGMADLFRHDTLRDPYLKKVVPSELLAWYSTPSGHWFAEQTRNEFGNAPDIKIQHIHLQSAAQGMRAAKFLHELGHPLLLGSDTPSAPTFGNQPGYDTYREMRLMAQSGIPLDAIFRAGTINNARQFKLDKDYGTVETGKIANLLLLETNPLETVRAWSMIQKIVLRGKIIERETLAADAM
jgi:imidazolonepropionase-like amidohydrolase